jgi:ABC-type lipoprotein release transport system permease subunit
MIISSSKLIVVSISLILAILTVSSSFSELFNSFRYTVYNCDIVIQNVTQTAKEYDELQKIDSVENVGYMYCFWDERTTYNEGKKFNTVPTILGQAKSCKYIKELDYKIEDLKYNELLIDEKLAEKNNIKIGDVLKINFESHNINSEFKVMGLINSAYFTTSRNVILVNLEYFFDNATEIPMQVHVNAKDNTDLEKLKIDIKKTLKEVGIDIQTVEEYLEDQESQVSSIMGLFYVIIVLAVFLSFIGIINNQVIGFIQRRKELAVLNSTCMSKKQLKHMLISETVLSNLIACLTAIFIAFLTTGMIDSFLQGMILYIDVVFNWSLAFKFSGIMFVLLLLTLFIPARRLNKLNIVNEIKYE